MRVAALALESSGFQDGHRGQLLSSMASAYRVFCPKLWNSLPANLQQPDIILQQFTWLLKTFFIMTDC